MPDRQPAEPNDFKEAADKIQDAGIADESAAYESAIDEDDEVEPEAHPS